MNFESGAPLRLSGAAFGRGLEQARQRPAKVEAVRTAVRRRLAAAEAKRLRARDYLDEQWRFTALHAPECVAETTGVAQGFGISPKDLFDYLHLGIVSDFEDGCSAWAVSDGPLGAQVGKNRDFRGEHIDLQEVFLHEDPAWNGRRILCVGSLGSPGAYSSGINSEGLAVVDTAVGTTDHGVGLLRYFLMTRLLARCGTVAEAIAEIRATKHAGGGTLVLGDAQRKVAAVELGASAVAIEEGGTAEWVVRTNHFLSKALAGTGVGHPGDPMAASSQGRLATLRDRLTRDLTMAEAVALMSSHDESGHTALCRHGEDGDARTISTSLFACGARTLYFCPGNPCDGGWKVFSA